MEHRIGTVEDAAALVDLRNRLADWLGSRGIRQWERDQIGAEDLTARLSHGSVLVWHEGERLVAAVSVLWSDPDIWSPGGDEAGYIHLLMVDRGWAGRGLGGTALGRAEQHIRDHGRRVARLDVTASNDALQRWYLDHGYRRLRTRRFDRPGWNDVMLLEKEL